ncbi:MAG: nuclear transport factor 2 family protein [Ignavibacteriae bacterium]|nr:nuclear transport factor 2 family protein [Ignavibacteriota bacterium]
MKFWTLISLMTLLCATRTVFGQNAPTNALTTLVETEKAFAAMSPEKGMKAAFLAYLADDGVLFRPGPVNGKEVWRKRPDSTSMRLDWEPTFADVAASGELGYTTGPWTLTPGPNLDQPPKYGFFVSVWKKQRDDQWKLAVDLGIENPHPEKVERTFATGEPTASSRGRGSMKTELARLLQAEQKLARLAKAGSSAAVRELGGENIRVYREGDVPSVGRDASIAKLTSMNEKLKLQVEKRVVAASRDLGYAYGKYDDLARQSTEAFAGYFVHIWKKDSAGNWKLVLDILNPPPTK